MDKKKFIPEVNTILEYHMEPVFESCKERDEAKDGDMLNHRPCVNMVIIVKPVYSEISELIGNTAYTLYASDILTLAKEIEALQAEREKLEYNGLPF